MGKKIYISILTLVTLLCIGVGIYWQYTGSFSSHGEIVNEQVALDEFTSLTVNGDIMDFTLKTGTDYKLTYSCSQNLEPVVRNQQGHVTLSQKSQQIWFSLHNQNCKVTLEIPTDACLDNLDVELDLGTLTLRDIQADRAELEADTGNITLSDCTLQTLKTEDDLGNVSADHSYLGNATLEADTGNVTLSSCDFANLTARSDLGNVKIDSVKDLNDYSIDAKCDLGDISIHDTKQGSTHMVNGTGPYKLVLRADTGNIRVDW